MNSGDIGRASVDAKSCKEKVSCEKEEQEQEWREKEVTLQGRKKSSKEGLPGWQGKEVSKSPKEVSTEEEEQVGKENINLRLLKMSCY